MTRTPSIGAAQTRRGFCAACLLTELAYGVAHYRSALSGFRREGRLEYERLALAYFARAFMQWHRKNGFPVAPRRRLRSTAVAGSGSQVPRPDS